MIRSHTVQQQAAKSAVQTDAGYKGTERIRTGFGRHGSVRAIARLRLNSPSRTTFTALSTPTSTPVIHRQGSLFTDLIRCVRLELSLSDSRMGGDGRDGSRPRSKIVDRLHSPQRRVTHGLNTGETSASSLKERLVRQPSGPLGWS
jgi:hypothetical protein